MAVDSQVGAPDSGPGLSRALVVLLGTAAAVVIGAGLKGAQGIVTPIMLSLVLTIAVGPIPRWARRKGWPGWAATLLGMIAAYLLVLVLAGGVAISAVQLASTLPEYAQKAQDMVHQLSQQLDQAGLSTSGTQKALSQIDFGKVLGLVGDLLSGVLGAASNLFFLVTLLFFLAFESTAMPARGELLRKVRPELADALTRFINGTQSYLIVTTVFGLIVATLDTLALWALGVPLPLVWGLLSFLTNFIPNIGFIIGLIPPALLGLLSGGWGTFFAVIAVYCVINVVLQTFIQPRFVGDAVGFSTTMTFLSMVLWTFLLGPVGALLAVPMSLLVRAFLIDADPKVAWAEMFIGPTPSDQPADPATPPASPPTPPQEPAPA
ncbi:AI-2E family transporter [Angustibacter luteus]|uniref:AI-2E family transporter n=1 Tax=Angustibacter luteus TaxID=658456 RepID=A0ABW1JDE3_9ACTN